MARGGRISAAEMSGSAVDEIVAEYRPVGIALAADFLVFLTIWAILYLVHLLGVIMPLGGTVGEWLVRIHDIAYAANYAVLALLGLVDIVRLRLLGKAGHDQPTG